MKSFKSLLNEPGITYLMEAHNGISAKIAEQTGFQALWASGFSMSASLGLRDANEASWTQVLEISEFMAESVDVPILLDGDTGFGNFNNVRRLVKKLEERGISGVCLEDKVFPKANSFVDKRQELADPMEFVGKIKAAKDSQRAADFAVVARTEALIAGASMDEALRRATLYAEAGADAVLAHSKRATTAEIDEFMARWSGIVPVVIVPTTYDVCEPRHFEEIGVSAVIWANQNLRSAIDAMQVMCRELFENRTTKSLSKRLASISDVFSLVDNDELIRAEARYLTQLQPDESQV